MKNYCVPFDVGIKILIIIYRSSGFKLISRFSEKCEERAFVIPFYPLLASLLFSLRLQRLKDCYNDKEAFPKVYTEFQKIGRSFTLK